MFFFIFQKNVGSNKKIELKFIVRDFPDYCPWHITKLRESQDYTGVKGSFRKSRQREMNFPFGIRIVAC